MLKKPQIQQNDVLRIILRVSKRTNIDNERTKFKILTLENERKLNLLCLAYKRSHKAMYGDTRSLVTRHYEAGRRQLWIDRPINNRYVKSYVHMYKKWWNELPTWYHRLDNVGQFKKSVQTHLELLESL